MKLIRYADLLETPWKNGGGVTRTIAARTEDDATLWRLSMADVAQGGPFSNFAGLTRSLTVVSGDGMVLHGPGGICTRRSRGPLPSTVRQKSWRN